MDLILRNGTVIDGTGAPRRSADVGVADEQVLHLASAVDEHRLRVLLQELVGIVRGEVLHGSGGHGRGTG